MSKNMEVCAVALAVGLATAGCGSTSSPEATTSATPSITATTPEQPAQPGQAEPTPRGLEQDVAKQMYGDAELRFTVSAQGIGKLVVNHGSISDNRVSTYTDIGCESSSKLTATANNSVARDPLPVVIDNVETPFAYYPVSDFCDGTALKNLTPATALSLAEELNNAQAGARQTHEQAGIKT